MTQERFQKLYEILSNRVGAASNIAHEINDLYQQEIDSLKAVIAQDKDQKSKWWAENQQLKAELEQGKKWCNDLNTDLTNTEIELSKHR